MAPADRKRLAVVLSHPIQYYSPWFAHLAATAPIDLRVFYLWDFGIERRHDPGFDLDVQWDIPLLDGYQWEMVPNRSKDPGTHHFFGLDNPDLVSRLHQWRPDAILLFGYAYASHLRVMLSPSLRRVPLLLRGDSHDAARLPGWKSASSRIARAILFRRFAAFLAVGNANAAYYRTSGVATPKIHFVPHCVDNRRFQQAAPGAERDAIEWKGELGIPLDRPVILFAGKFETKKRPLDLLRAFAAIDGNAVLLFTGAGPLEGELKKEAGDRIGRSVFFAPFQNQSRMPVVYAAGNVLVLPSYGVGETWGLAVNEAMNLARPAIVSSHVGCGPDLIREAQTGWIFEAGSIDALAAALKQAMRDPERLRGMGRAALDLVGRYSFEAAGSGLLRALDAVVPVR
jgi:glycosyltransferase involved in cell wall biosynthesis